MQKFGSGEVQHDPEDPQGVSVTPSTTHQGALNPQGLDHDLAEENTRADVAPSTELGER